MTSFTLIRRFFNLSRDIVFLYLFEKRCLRQETSGKQRIPGLIAMAALFALYTAEDGGIFANPWIRFGYRWLCGLAFLMFSGPVSKRTALYVSLLGDVSVVLIHNVFLTPMTRPLVLGRAVFTGNPLLDMILCFVITNALTILFYIAVYRLLPVEEIDEINGFRVFLALTTSVACIYLNEQLRLVTDNQMELINSYSIFSVILELTLMACIIFVEQLQLNYRRRTEETMRTLAAQSQLENVREQMKNNEKVRELRHDMRNHLNILDMLITNGNQEKALEYVHSLSGEYTASRTQFHTGNMIADSLLSQKLNKAQEQGVPVETAISDIRFDGIEDMDLCTILANILDNAIEAVSQQENTAERYIRLRMYQKAGMNMIIVENSYDGTRSSGKDGFFPSSKQQTDEHGLGLRSVQRAAEKYHGALSVSADNDKQIFRLAVSLPLQV